MNTRMTWNEIVEKYPKQYVYLTEIEWDNSLGQKVSSAIVIHATPRNDDVKYIEKAINGECVEEYTDHAGMTPMGVLSL